MLSLIHSLRNRCRTSLWRAARNAHFNALNWAIVPVMAIVTTPLMLSELGASTYGVWILIRCITNFSELADCGLTDATIRYVSYYKGKGHRDPVVWFARTTTSFYLVLGIVSSAVFFFCSPLIMRFSSNATAPVTPVDIYALRILSVNILFIYAQKIFSSILFGFERFDIAAKITMVCNILMYISYIISVKLNFGIMSLAVITTGYTLLSCIGLFLAVKRKVLSSYSLKPLFSWRLMRRILSFSLYGWGTTIISVACSNIDRILLSKYLGSTQVAYYSVVKQLMTYINGFLAQGSRFLFPMIGKLSANFQVGEIRDRAKRIYLLSSALLSIVGHAMIIPLLYLGNCVLRFWVGEDVALHTSTIMLLWSVRALFFPNSVLNYHFLLGSGNIRVSTLVSVSLGLVTLVGVFLLTPRYGMVGTAVAQLVTVPFVFLIRAFVEKRLFGSITMKLQVLCYLPMLLVIGLSLWMAASIAVYPKSMVSLLASLTIAGVFSAVLLAAAWLPLVWKDVKLVLSH